MCNNIYGAHFFPLDYQKSLLNPFLSKILNSYFAENSTFTHTLAQIHSVAPLHTVKGAPNIWYV